jgi:hypothetical protein
MAEALGLAASIIAVSQLTTTVVHYLDGVRNASEDVRSLREELTNTSRILYQLRDLATLFSDSNIPFPAIQTLQASGGPLEQFKKILEALSSQLGRDERGFKHVSRLVGWPLRKDEVKEILASLERYKTLFLLALSNDQMQVIMLDKVASVAH